MKITKLMLSAFVAAVALVACNKENHTPVENSLKSVTISLENAIMTKGASDGAITSGTPVSVKNLKIFLLDDQGNSYGASVINDNGTVSSAVMYYDFSAENIPTEINYHYVDPAVTQVVAYANLGDVKWENINDVLTIADEQNPEYLTLYGMDDQLANAGEKKHDNGDVTVLYEASVHLVPRVSRFELDGFRIAFTPGKAPDYASITVSKIAFANYYPNSSAATGVESGEIEDHDINIESDSSVFDWFNNTATYPAAGEWYWDNISKVLTPDSPAAASGPYAYHFFSCDEIPVLIIDLVADGRPAYLYTKSFSVIGENGQTTPLTIMEEGKVYRMNASSTVGGTDNGYIEIPEEVIDPANHCIDITLTVEDWFVTLVRPEFK